MDFWSIILFPFKWVIEALLVAFHALTVTVGFDGDGGASWVLAVLGLVIVVRAALLPSTLRQIRAQRIMLRLGPQLREIQAKYKGKTDQASREAQSKEMVAVYKEAGSGPFASFLPILIQLPVFFSLVAVLRTAELTPLAGGVGLLTPALSSSFGAATLFGVPLKITVGSAIFSGGASLALGLSMLLVVILAQMFTQIVALRRNTTLGGSAAARRSAWALVLILPFLFLLTGFAFPLGVMFYWVFSTLWTVVQQLGIIRWYPNPGSHAAIAREKRLARRNPSVDR